MAIAARVSCTGFTVYSYAPDLDIPAPDWTGELPPDAPTATHHGITSGITRDASGNPQYLTFTCHPTDSPPLEIVPVPANGGFIPVLDRTRAPKGWEETLPRVFDANGILHPGLSINYQDHGFSLIGRDLWPIKNGPYPHKEEIETLSKPSAVPPFGTFFHVAYSVSHVWQARAVLGAAAATLGRAALTAAKQSALSLPGEIPLPKGPWDTLPRGLKLPPPPKPWELPTPTPPKIPECVKVPPVDTSWIKWLVDWFKGTPSSSDASALMLSPPPAPRLPVLTAAATGSVDVDFTVHQGPKGTTASGSAGGSVSHTTKKGTTVEGRGKVEVELGPDKKPSGSASGGVTVKF